MTTRKFRDISLTFAPHPVNGDVVTKTDANAVKQSIRHLLLTMHYDIPFHPEEGSQLYGMLFENVSMMTLQIAKQEVINIITQKEPRALLQDVVVENMLQNNSVKISVFFKVVNSDVVEMVSVFVDRKR